MRLSMGQLCKTKPILAFLLGASLLLVACVLPIFGPAAARRWGLDGALL